MSISDRDAGASDFDPLPSESLARAARIIAGVLGAPVRLASGPAAKDAQPTLSETAQGVGPRRRSDGTLMMRLLPPSAPWDAKHVIANRDLRAPAPLLVPLRDFGANACAVVPLPGEAAAPYGAIGVFSSAPREWPERVVAALEELAQWLGTEIELRRGALRDPLTGLPNRTLLLERLDHAITRARRHGDFRFAVLSLDLDGIGLVNASLGQQAGDELLKIVADRLLVCIRGEDLAARVSGDKFAILLESLSDDADAGRVAQRIHRALADPVALARQEVYTGASIGVALSSSGLAPAATMLQHAVIAMTRAKQSGRGRFEMFDRAMQERAAARLKAETDLRHAIDRQEFELYYQPLVALDTGSITELEALIRWRSPERGIVPPLDFIPLAEETGLIFPMGSWVLTQACRQLKEWQERFSRELPLAVSVNISAKQLSHADLVPHVADIVTLSGIDPASLKLEITESSLIEDPEGTGARLQALRQLGVRIYLDDFGTGYSSLRYLHQLPLDAIKIDRSFVALMHEGATHLQLVHTVRALARNIGVRAIAEGVENPVQLSLLRSLGCESAQGFYFSRPVPKADVERMLANNPVW